MSQGDAALHARWLGPCVSCCPSAQQPVWGVAVTPKGNELVIVRIPLLPCLTKCLVALSNNVVEEVVLFELAWAALVVRPRVVCAYDHPGYPARH